MTREVEKLNYIKVKLESRKDWVEKDIEHARNVERDENKNILEKLMWEGNLIANESELNFINNLLEIVGNPFELTNKGE